MIFKNRIKLPNGLPKETKAIVVNVFLGSAKIGTVVKIGSWENTSPAKIYMITRLWFPDKEDITFLIPVPNNEIWWQCSEIDITPKFELRGYFLDSGDEYKNLMMPAH
jgi:hypothetical protein